MNQRMGSNKFLSDVVVCFIAGALLSNTKIWWLHADWQTPVDKIVEKALPASILLAIPMLLMVSRLGSTLRAYRSLLLSFFLALISAIAAAFLTILVSPPIDQVAETAGCLVGVYTGGTPNMAAISYALQLPPKLFVLLNTTDVCISGIYFLLLTSVVKPILLRWLPAYQAIPELEVPEDDFSAPKETSSSLLGFYKDSWSSILKSLGLTICCIAIAAGLGLLFPTATGDLNELVVMVVLTSLSIASSFLPMSKKLVGVQEIAEYLLLIFVFGIGYLANLAELSGVGWEYLSFNAWLVVFTLLLHFLLGKWFKIDADTLIISSTACVFGPPFMGQVCSAIKNKQLLAAGMALGVLGLILGTYLGLLTTWLVTIWGLT